MSILQGLLIAKADKWRQHRRIVAKGFQSKLLEQFVNVMNRQTNALVSILSQNDGEHFDFYPQLAQYTFDVIFGESYL